MKSFQDILQAQGDEFLDRMMNDYVIVYEKLSASTLSFKRTGDELHFYKGSDKEEITSVNATLYSYFQKGIDYLKNASLVFYREFPEGWLFSFKYFVDNKTNIIEYDYTPQNNLVLSFIDNGSNIIEDPDILKRWAERLQTDYAQPLFQGFLTEFQKEKINDYVQGKYSDDIPFSQYMISLLNPAMNHSNYKNGFSGGVDSFIFKFYSPNSKKCVCAKIMDPYMASILKNREDSFEKNKYGNETEIILANFIAFLQTVNIDKIEVEGGNDEDRYLDLICKLFNMYIKKERSLFLPKDRKEDKKVDENYTVNFDNIKNKETAKLLKDNPNLVTAFQIIVGNFAQYKDPQSASTLSLLDKDLIGIFNGEVSKIKEASMEKKEKTKTFNELMADEKEKNSETEKVLSYDEFLKKEGIPVNDKPARQEQPVPKKEDDKPVEATANKEKEKEDGNESGAETKETKGNSPEKEHLEKQETPEKETEKKEEKEIGPDKQENEKPEEENEKPGEQKTGDEESGENDGKESGEENGEKEQNEKKPEEPEKKEEPKKEEPSEKEEPAEPKETPKKEEPEKKEKPEKQEKPAKKEQPKKDEAVAL
jgi:hypothetical protein